MINFTPANEYPVCENKTRRINGWITQEKMAQDERYQKSTLDFFLGREKASPIPIPHLTKFLRPSQTENTPI